jgi:hypothetical protein
MRRPAPAQRKQSSGVGKALLIAGLVLAVTGCLGISALGFLYSLTLQNGAEGGENSFANSPPFPGSPPPGTHPNLANAPPVASQPPSRPPRPHPSAGKEKVFGPEDGLIDVPGAEHEGLVALKPGCYLNEAILEAEEDASPDEPWGFVGQGLRVPVKCPSGRRGKPSAQAQRLSEEWPFPEEILAVEDAYPPMPAPDDPGRIRKGVRVRTRVSADHH